jgi:single-strand DNA-binding protein
MNALNSILIEGNVIADPEKHERPRGSTVCSFKIASSRFYRQDETTKEEKAIFDIEAWAKLAESCTVHCTEGRGVRVVGRLKQCEDGSIKVVAEHVEFKPVLNKKSS